MLWCVPLLYQVDETRLKETIHSQRCAACAIELDTISSSSQPLRPNTAVMIKACHGRSMSSLAKALHGVSPRLPNRALVCQVDRGIRGWYADIRQQGHPDRNLPHKPLPHPSATTTSEAALRPILHTFSAQGVCHLLPKLRKRSLLPYKRRSHHSLPIRTELSSVLNSYSLDQAV
jgi:hypothetical protein